MKAGILACSLLDAPVGLAEAFQQAALRIGIGRVGVDMLDGIHGDAAGELSTFTAPHAIGDHSQPAQAAKRRGVWRFPIAVAIFVILPLAADIAEAGHLNPRTNLHCARSLQEAGIIREPLARKPIPCLDATVSAFSG